LPLREKKAQKLSPLKKWLLSLMLKLWCSSGTMTPASVDLALTMAAQPVHPNLTPPPPFDSLPLAHTHDDEGEESREQDEDDEGSLSKISSTSFLCFMTKWGKGD
jgi:hypothetical protein